MHLLAFPHRFIADEDEYKKFARSYHKTVIIALCFLMLLLVLRYKPQKVEYSYSWATGCLADTMGRFYISTLGVSTFFWAIGSHHRVFEEVAMLSGFSTVMFLSLYVFGARGIWFIFLPVCPPLRAAYFWPFIPFF